MTYIFPYMGICVKFPATYIFGEAQSLVPGFVTHEDHGLDFIKGFLVKPVFEIDKCY